MEKNPENRSSSLAALHTGTTLLRHKMSSWIFLAGASPGVFTGSHCQGTWSHQLSQHGLHLSLPFPFTLTSQSPCSAQITDDWPFWIFLSTPKWELSYIPPTLIETTSKPNISPSSRAVRKLLFWKTIHC